MAHLHQPQLEVPPIPLGQQQLERIEAMQYHALRRCADEVAFQFRNYDCWHSWIDRVGNIEFLADQMCCDNDTLNPQFHVWAWDVINRYEFIGFII